MYLYISTSHHGLVDIHLSLPPSFFSRQPYTNNNNNSNNNNNTPLGDSSTLIKCVVVYSQEGPVYGSGGGRNAQELDLPPSH